MKINYLILSFLLALAEKDKKIDFAVGGQAVIEGVMMRSPNHVVVSVRKQKGEIVRKEIEYVSLIKRKKYLNIPVVRGVVNLFEMMVLGSKAINYSANESLEEEPKTQGAEPQTSEKITPEKATPSRFGEVLMFGASMLIAIALSIFLFKMIPLWSASLLQQKFSFIEKNYIVFNLIDGGIKFFMFFSYIFILSLIPSFRRVFQYHGAEHKSIFTYEADEELIVENASKKTRFHPRCGTSFIFIVLAMSIVVYTLIPKHDDFWVNLSIRVFTLPLIAGISYEYLKFSAKHSGNKIMKFFITPGLWFQKITTKEPEPQMIAVAIDSLKSVLNLEKNNKPE